MKPMRASALILIVVALALGGAVLGLPAEAAEEGIVPIAPETETLQSVAEAPLDLEDEIIICQQNTCICYECIAGQCRQVPSPFPCI